jgi:hypothetical protein
MIISNVRKIQDQKLDYLHNNTVIAEIIDKVDEKYASGDVR